MNTSDQGMDADRPRRTERSLSIIIPARNEARFIGPTLERALSAEDAEVIVVDAHSDDRTAEIARSYGALVLSSPPGRARQMNLGAIHAVGDVLLFLHADTNLPIDFDRTIRAVVQQPGIIAGAFRLRISASNISLRLIESMVYLRNQIFQLPYGDQAIFMKAGIFRHVGGYPLMPVMEDYELIRRVRRLG